jgi:hypothetical protein
MRAIENRRVAVFQRERRMSQDFTQRLKRGGRDRMERGKRAAAEQISDIAEAIDRAGAQLDETQPMLASYAAKIADGVGDLAMHLREESFEDLYRRTRVLALRHPGMFLLGSVALGVAVARFMKATAMPDIEARRL